MSTLRELEAEIRELEAEMCRLVAARIQRVATGQALIDAANKDFDRAALRLGRQINQLRASLPAPPHQLTRHKPAILDGLTEQEQQHYLELREKVKA